MRKSSRKRLVLLDAHAIIHRAYHALPDFTGPDGQPTGALYGLSAMLIRIIETLEPDYIAACYDLPKPTVRHEAYEDYKGTRAKTDDTLVAQLQTSRNVFKAFSIPVYEREGFEADDILGTIVELLKDEEVEIVIASGDMDTLQLVDQGRVQVYTLKKGLNDTIMYDEASVLERFGFSPERIPDYKGLRGDPSDNIKGVPGIGDKTATELVTLFGSVEELYEALKEDEEAFQARGVKPRIVNLLKEYEEDALFSKMLATIRRDAPIAFQLPEAVYRDGEQLPKILALFDELGFRSLRGRLRSALQAEEGDDDVEEDIEEASEEEVDPTRLKEAGVMVWLLASDFTNPAREDVMAFTSCRTFDEAYTALEARLKDAGRVREVYERIERPLIPVLSAMKEHGVLVDKTKLNELAKRYRKELSEVEKRIFKVAGREFNISSPKQLGEVLFDELALAVPKEAGRAKKTATGQRSTRESELEKLKDQNPIIEDVLEYRQIQKLLSTYVESLPQLLDEENRLHADFLQTGTTTGRMASQNPNLQNIPIRTERGRAIRDAFIAPPGFEIVALDYSQIELRLAAILSGDEKLCEIFRSGRDVHQEVASQVFGVPSDAVDREMRRRAKIINFGILYGMGVNALKVQLGTSAAEAHRFYDDYFATFTRLAQYLEETKGFARKHGYTQTLFGRRREFPQMKSPLPYVRAQAERMAINAPIQGTQSDIIKLAMVEVDEYLRQEGKSKDVHLILQVHDELVYEVRATELEEITNAVRRIMEGILSADDANHVPILVEAKRGPNWGELSEMPRT